MSSQQNSGVGAVFDSLPSMMTIADALCAAVHEAGSAALAFSGGKESCVLAHMLRPVRDLVELVWVNTGAGFPWMADFVRAFSADWRLIEVHGARDEFEARNGLAVRVLPLRLHPTVRAYFTAETKGPLLIDWPTCCQAVRVKPGRDYMLKRRPGLAIFGQRAEDGYAMEHDAPSDGIPVVMPLWRVRLPELREYIRAHRIALPAQYPELEKSCDCWDCSARWTSEKLAWLGKHHPSMRDRLMERIAVVERAAVASLEQNAREVDAGLSGRPIAAQDVGP